MLRLYGESSASFNRVIRVFYSHRQWLSHVLRVVMLVVDIMVFRTCSTVSVLIQLGQGIQRQ
jgi:hypothetical protein